MVKPKFATVVDIPNPESAATPITPDTHPTNSQRLAQAYQLISEFFQRMNAIWDDLPPYDDFIAKVNAAALAGDLPLLESILQGWEEAERFRVECRLNELRTETRTWPRPHQQRLVQLIDQSVAMGMHKWKAVQLACSFVKTNWNAIKEAS